MKRLLPLVLLAALLPRPAAAWSDHYLVTDRALREADVAAAMDKTVPVESFDTFLAAEGPGLQKVFADYAAWQVDRKQKRFANVPFDGAHPTVEGFLRAARLNPKATFPLVVRKLPGGPSFGASVPSTTASPYLTERAPLVAMVEEVTPGTALPIRTVMATFADEPDWGFDHELWGFAEYGYGEEPYGRPTGESSKAAFHMLFLHENVLVKMAAPEVLEGMVLDREELFLRLSKYALSTGHPYWGYRFAAWAAHYVQDICQPYHSRAVPSAGTGWYIKYIFSKHQDQMKSDATTLAGNRHFIYEDFVAYGLQQSYFADAGEAPKDARYSALAGFLSSGRAAIPHVDSAEDLIHAISGPAAKHSRLLDRVIVDAVGPAKTMDPAYDVGTAADYNIGDVMKTMDAKGGDKLLEETGKDFTRAGEATRTVVALVTAP